MISRLGESAVKTEKRLTNTADFNRGNALTEHLNSFLLCPVFGTEFSSFLLQIINKTDNTVIGEIEIAVIEMV